MTDSSTTPPHAPVNGTDWPRAIATVGGLGFVRVAPGTVASIAALPVAWLVMEFGGRSSGRFWLLFLAIFTAAVGAWACELYSRARVDPDPSECVIDEVAGQLLICAFLPFPPTFWGFLLAFVLFRVFDITKMWPINWVERNVPGGLGIMADDIVAALIGSVIIAILANLGTV